MTLKEYFKSDRGNLILFLLANIVLPIPFVIVILFPSGDAAVDTFVMVLLVVLWLTYNIANFINYLNKKNKRYR